MKWIRVLVAFGLAGTLAAAAWRFRAEPASESRGAATMLVAEATIDAERVDEVVLDREGTRYRFARKGSGWQQLEPVPHAIDGWSVRQLVTKLLKAESVRTVQLGGLPEDARRKQLEDAGLAPPVGRIEVIEPSADGGARRSVVVELGRRSLAGRAYARRVPDGPAASFEVIDGALHEFALGRDPKEFRKRELFADLGEVDRLSFRAGESSIGLVRDGRGYRLDAPVKSRADRVQTEEFLDALRRAKSGGFVSDRPVELAAYGLAPAMATLELEGGGVTRTLRIGDAVSIGAQDRFGMLDGTSTVVRVPAEVLATIVPRLDRLLDAVATAVRARDVAGIEISSGVRRISLRRETNGWSASVGEQGSTEAIAGEVEQERVDGLLKALSETRAQAVEVAAFPQDSSIATITLTGFGGEPLDTVRIARRASDSKWILENGDGVLRLHGAIELPLSSDELGFRPKK